MGLKKAGVEGRERGCQTVGLSRLVTEGEGRTELQGSGLR